MNKSFLFIIGITLLMSLIFAGCAQQSSPPPSASSVPANVTPATSVPVPKASPAASTTQSPTTPPSTTTSKLTILKAVYGTPSAKGPITQNYINEVNKRGAGLIKIEVMGGTEVIPPFDQADALRTGAIDMNVYLPPEYAEALMPAALCMGLTSADFAQERQIGAYDLWVEAFQKSINARYLGRNDGYLQAQLFLRKPITSVGDLKGIIIRASPMYDPMVKGLGASSVVMPLPEVFGALEKGVIDGIITMERGPKDFSLQKVAKFMILPRFFQGSSSIMVNNDVWKKLPKEAQDIVLNTLLEQQPTMLNSLKAEREALLKNYTENNMQEIRLSAEDSKKFLDVAYNTTWEYVIKKAPDYGPKFRELENKLTK